MFKAILTVFGGCNGCDDGGDGCSDSADFLDASRDDLICCEDGSRV
jgi:hypothetical protein